MSITRPYGVDVYIEPMKEMLQADLWDGLSYTSYGRAFLNIKENFKIPEILIDGTNEYQEILFNDKLNATSFFYVHDERGYALNEFSVNVDVIFQVKLDKLYSTLTHRATEEALSDVERTLKGSVFKIKNIKTGLLAYENFTLRDLSEFNFQPNFLFKFETELKGIYRKCET